MGHNDSGSISASYATGPVSASSSPVGGLAGRNAGTITASYATGPVTGSSDVGGLIGYNSSSGTVTACFWDKDTSGQTSSAGGAGKTTAEMKTQSTFTDAGWDFIDPNDPAGDWFMPQADYPRLAWQVASMVSVPPLRGLTPTQAQAVLSTAGLLPGESYYVYDLSLEPGLVSDSSPTAGTLVDPNSTRVQLFLAKHTKYSAGSGTQLDPYQIATPGDWLDLMGASPDWNKQFVLTADIDLAALPITPAGNYTTKFTGVFDGQGHVIRNAVINTPATDYVGLFGYLGAGAQIRNLGLANGSMTGWSCVGGLVGENYAGTISACYASAPVTSSFGSVGGLVGYNYSGLISACYATGPVTGLSEVGGLVGFNYYGTILASYATGRVTGLSDVGGLVGLSNSIAITRSFWDTQTSGQPSSNGGTGKTTAQMKTKTTFTDAGWHFLGDPNGTPDNWRMCVDGVSYPLLTWQFVRAGDFACPDGVNLDDLARLAQDWLTIPPQPFFGADANGDSLIDLRDFALLAQYWLR